MERIYGEGWVSRSVTIRLLGKTAAAAKPKKDCGVLTSHD